MSIDEALEAIKSDTNVKFKDLLKVCEQFFEGPKAKSYQVKQVREALMKLKETQGE